MAKVYNRAMAKELLREDRVKRLQPEKVVGVLGLSGGETVGDIGCGPGIFTLLLAKKVGEKGKVFGIDTSQDMLDVLDERAETAGLGNIEGVHSEETKIPLRDNMLDALLLANLLHHASDKVIFLREIWRLLAHRGRLLVMEPKVGSGDAQQKKDRLPLKEIQTYLAQVGFRDVSVHPILDDYEVVAARKEE